MKYKIILILAIFLGSTSIVTTSGVVAVNAAECSSEDPCGVWAMLDPQGTVTNIIVCQPSVCGGGSWAGQKVVPQVAANPVTHDTHGIGGYWGTYDSESKEFTVDRSGPNDSQSLGSSTRMEESADGVNVEVTTTNSAKTFKYEDTLKTLNDFNSFGEPINGWNQNYLKDKSLPDSSNASIKVTKQYIENEITQMKEEYVQLLKRMTESELEQNMQSENKTLILENFSTVVRLLGVWIKQSKIELNTL